MWFKQWSAPWFSCQDATHSDKWLLRCSRFNSHECHCKTKPKKTVSQPNPTPTPNPNPNPTPTQPNPTQPNPKPNPKPNPNPKQLLYRSSTLSNHLHGGR